MTRLTGFIFIKRSALPATSQIPRGGCQLPLAFPRLFIVLENVLNHPIFIPIMKIHAWHMWQNAVHNLSIRKKAVLCLKWFINFDRPGRAWATSLWICTGWARAGLGVHGPGLGWARIWWARGEHWWGITVHTSFASFSPVALGCMNTRVVVTNGDVLDVNVRSLVPDVTLQFPQELGVPVTVGRLTGLKKSTSRMPSWSPKR